MHSGKSVKVLDCRGNVARAMVAGAAIHDTDAFQAPGMLTVCFRFQFQKLRPLNILASAQNIADTRPMFQFREYL